MVLFLYVYTKPHALINVTHAMLCYSINITARTHASTTTALCHVVKNAATAAIPRAYAAITVWRDVISQLSYVAYTCRYSGCAYRHISCDITRTHVPLHLKYIASSYPYTYRYSGSASNAL